MGAITTKVKKTLTRKRKLSGPTKQRAVRITKSEMTDKRIEFLKNKKSPNRRTRRAYKPLAKVHALTFEEFLLKSRKKRLNRLKNYMARQARKLNRIKTC